MATPTVDKPKIRPGSKSKKAAKTAPGAVPLSLSPAGSMQRRRQLPWAVLGILLIGCSILGFALWTINQAERTPVLVAARDIDAGQLITRNDVSTVAVGADPGVRLLSASDAGLVVGGVARGPIPAGTPLSPLLVAESDAVPAGRSIVGASLSPGEYPTSALRAGDRVQMVEVVSGLAGGGERLDALGTAEIWTVEQLLSGGAPELFISLSVVDADAPAVVNTISQDRLRLVLIGAGE